MPSIRFLFAALFTGLLTGGLAVGFRLALEQAEAARDTFAAWCKGLGSFAYPAMVIGFSVSAGLGVFLVRRFAPEACGSGIPHIKALLQGRSIMRWPRVLIVKFFGGILAIGSGLVLGREGPTVQMGGALGFFVSRRGFPLEEQRWLMAIGAGAGLTGAFNAPLAGLIFVMEELGLALGAGMAFAGLGAMLVSDLICRLTLGQQPILGEQAVATPAIGTLPAFLALGLVTGLVGIAYNRTLLATLELKDRAEKRWGGIPVCFAVVLLVSAYCCSSELLGGGGEVIVQKCLQGHWSLLLALLLMSGRFLGSIGSYATGAAGGVFAPLLAIGALAGAAAAEIIQAIPTYVAVDHKAFVIAGMASTFTAVLRAPITGLVLAVAVTGADQTIFYLMAASLVAHLVAEAAGVKPLYNALLERDLAKSIA